MLLERATSSNFFPAFAWSALSSFTGFPGQLRHLLGKRVSQMNIHHQWGSTFQVRSPPDFLLHMSQALWSLFPSSVLVNGSNHIPQLCNKFTLLFVQKWTLLSTRPICQSMSLGPLSLDRACCMKSVFWLKCLALHLLRSLVLLRLLVGKWQVCSTCASPQWHAGSVWVCRHRARLSLRAVCRGAQSEGASHPAH